MEMCAREWQSSGCGGKEIQVFRAAALVRPGVCVNLFVFMYSHGAVAISMISSYPLSIISLEII